jgi:hypothetical protein
MAARDEITFEATAEFCDCSAGIVSAIFCILSIEKGIFTGYVNIQN